MSYIGKGETGGIIGKGETGGIDDNQDQIFMEFGRTIKQDQTIKNGVNTLSVGPIIIEDGVIVTVEDDGNWVVV